jgi:putative ABC transport system permease protein
VTARDLAAFAGGALAGRRLRSALSLAGVAIGIAAVVVLTALGEGARRYVLDQFAQIGSNFVAILPGRTETRGGFPGIGGAASDLTLDDVRALRRALPEARRVEPMVVGTETVAAGGRDRRVVVVGATAGFVELRRIAIASGRSLPELDLERGAPVALIGHRVARELFGTEEAVGRTVRVGATRCRVLGVTASRGQQLGLDLDEVVMIPVATAMRIFDRSSLFRVIVEARSAGEVDRLRDRSLALLVERHGREDVTVMTEDAVVASLSSILGALTLAAAAIAAISLAVAGIGIMNVMLVSVSERTAEIGLLRALGAGRRQILACFLAEAALLASAGGVVGLAAGWLGVRVLVGIWPELPAAPPAWAIVAALALSVAVGLGFGWLPARRATRLDPVAALARR